jgi:hypothetical protein
MKEYGCQGMTGYLAKIYLDRYLLQQNDVTTDQLQLLAMAALKLAVKVSRSYNSVQRELRLPSGSGRGEYSKPIHGRGDPGHRAAASANTQIQTQSYNSFLLH